MIKMKKIKEFIKKIGPGFITGASDDDPSGIATYAQTGAAFGYSQLWTSVFSFPFMTVVQEMCGRIGIVTGKGIAGIVKQHYLKSVLYVMVFLLTIANTVNIGADLGAMAASAKLVVGLPFEVLLLGLSISTLLLQVFIPYITYAKYLKYLTLSLFAYIATAFFVKQNWSNIAIATFIPTITFSKEYLLNIVAVLGTTISPYLFFWQASEEVEEKREHHKLGRIGKGDIRDMRIDTVAGMFFSNLVMFFIIVTAASTLNSNGITSIETADQAALALKPFAGNYAFLLFALGIVGTGLLAVPILAGSAAYAISEVFNWKAGLGKKFSQAHGFYGVIIAATIIGLFVNFTPIKPFQMLYYAAIINGICAPPLMILIMLISNNKNIMGEHTNSPFSNTMGWTITGVMTIAAVALFLTL
jgi:NRAMP (natural resistance-associated macrophage protein)-like metal ion transporter